MINFYSEEVEIPDFDTKKTITWISEVINAERKGAGEISIIFCSDDYLLNINNTYLQHNYFTDVITFDYSENNFISGDIFISIDTVSDNAKQYNISFVHELHRIMIHGVLHLIGFNDKTDSDKKIMTSKEDVYLSKIQL